MLKLNKLQEQFDFLIFYTGFGSCVLKGWSIQTGDGETFLLYIYDKHILVANAKSRWILAEKLWRILKRYLLNF